MGAFEQLFRPVRGEFEPKFSKNSNAWGVARGGCSSFDLPGTLERQHLVQILTRFGLILCIDGSIECNLVSFTIKLILPLKLASSNSSASAAQDKGTSSFTAGIESFGAMNVTGTTALLLSATALFEWLPCDCSYTVTQRYSILYRGQQDSDIQSM